jgi:hypothetical protein
MGGKNGQYSTETFLPIGQKRAASALLAVSGFLQTRPFNCQISFRIRPFNSKVYNNGLEKKEDDDI